jgi:hypothetical protein
MPKKYQKLGISFQYPDNWTLDEADAVEGRQSVTVYSPGGAFWSIGVYTQSLSPVQVVKSSLRAMREEYPEIEVEQIRETVVDRKMIGYDLNFYYLDFTNSAQIRSFKIGQTSYSIFCQGEDREFDRVKALFNAMTTSLIKELQKV